MTIPCHEDMIIDNGIDYEIYEINNIYGKEIRQRNLSKIQMSIINAFYINPKITLQEMAKQLHISLSALRYQRVMLEKKGIFLKRLGATKKGTWKLIFH